MKTCIKTAFFSIGVSFAITILQDSIKTTYLATFLRSNLISLLIALIAINTATLGVVLTKIRDIADKHNKLSCFEATRKEMILSIREQLALVISGTLFLMLEESEAIKAFTHGQLAVKVLICSVFVYAIFVLYDTAKSVFAILDFGSEQK